MKNFVLVALMGLFVLTSCSKSQSDDDGGIPQDLSELIIGKWQLQGFACNGGYTFDADLTKSWEILRVVKIVVVCCLLVALIP